jgi:hypothetical protein
VLFGVTSGSYSHQSIPVTSGNTLDLSGPITFSATPALPSWLTDLTFTAETTIGTVVRDEYDQLIYYTFSGPFEMTGTPEPSTALLVVGGLVGLAAAGRRRSRR